eukprot:tig00020805_g14000.t1
MFLLIADGVSVTEKIAQTLRAGSRRLHGAQGGQPIRTATFSGDITNLDGSPLDTTQITDALVAQRFSDALGLPVPESAVDLTTVSADLIHLNLELLAVEVCPPGGVPAPARRLLGASAPPQCLREALVGLLLDLGFTATIPQSFPPENPSNVIQFTPQLRLQLFGQTILDLTQLQLTGPPGAK